MKKLLIAALAGLALGGCASRPAALAPQSRMEFPLSEYEGLAKTGTASVSGQAFLKTRGGDVKTAAGNEILLNPVTSYSMEWYIKQYTQGLPLVPPDSRLTDYQKRATADGSGRFSFKGVPPGEYFVTAVVTWEAPAGYLGELQTQGGLVTKRLVVKDGESYDVIITR